MEQNEERERYEGDDELTVMVSVTERIGNLIRQAWIDGFKPKYVVVGHFEYEMLCKEHGVVVDTGTNATMGLSLVYIPVESVLAVVDKASEEYLRVVAGMKEKENINEEIQKVYKEGYVSNTVLSQFPKGLDEL